VDFLFQPFHEPPLLHDHRIHLLHLMLEVGDVRFDLAEPGGDVIVHGLILPSPPREVEPGNISPQSQFAKSKSEQLIK